MKDRYWSGWGEFRYGNAKPVSLPAVSIQKPVKLVRGQARDRMQRSVLDALRDWRFSPFEREAGVRLAVRRHFIGRGKPWGSSDEEAAVMVAVAFATLGAERPSLAEGQWQYTAAREQCMHCGCEIAEDDQIKGYRFCSGICARSARQRQADGVAYNENWIVKRAEYEIMTRDAPPRNCVVCDRVFRNFMKTATCCSPRCARLSRGDAVAPIACGHCGVTFQPPGGRRQRFCSKVCGMHARVESYRQSHPEISCGGCGSLFRPGRKGSVTCSPACAQRAYYRRKAAAKAMPANVIYLSAKIFDGWFKRAA
jgi:hypothetical protein